jgi:hypothetical protein
MEIQERLELISPAQNKEYFDQVSDSNCSEKLTSGIYGGLLGLVQKPQLFREFDLPKDFKDRTFVKDISSLCCRLEEIPGHVVKFNRKGKDYLIVSITRFVKDSLFPACSMVCNGVLYNGMVTPRANFNGSIFMGGLTVEKGTIAEVVIQDVMESVVADDHVSKCDINIFAKSISDVDIKDYYYVKGCTLSLINSKEFSLQRFDSKSNKTYVTVEGKIYAANSHFESRRVVSLELIPLEALL